MEEEEEERDSGRQVHIVILKRVIECGRHHQNQFFGTETKASSGAAPSLSMQLNRSLISASHESPCAERDY